MNPPIESYVQTDSDCVAVFGDRVQPFGYADQQIVEPYATWQIISGEAFNTLGCSPTTDRYRVQFDVWAKRASVAQSSAETLRNAMEKYGYLVGYNGSGRDAETKLYRFSFDMEFLNERI